MSQQPHYVTPSVFSAGVSGHCPRCGQGKLFSGFLKAVPACIVCKLDIGSLDSGDGPAVFIILIAGFIVAGAAAYTEIAYGLSYVAHALLWGPLAVILPLILLRPSKGIMIALIYRNNAQLGKRADE